MDEVTDRRRGRRVKTRFVALFAAERVDGEGVLANISYTGAMIEEATMLPKVGREVRICINLPDDAGSFEIAGQVMRHIERGFAIEYEKPHPDLCYLIDDTAAVVRIFRQSRFNAVKS